MQNYKGKDANIFLEEAKSSMKKVKEEKYRINSKKYVNNKKNEIM